MNKLLLITLLGALIMATENLNAQVVKPLSSDVFFANVSSALPKEYKSQLLKNVAGLLIQKPNHQYTLLVIDEKYSSFEEIKYRPDIYFTEFMVILENFYANKATNTYREYYAHLTSSGYGGERTTHYVKQLVDSITYYDKTQDADVKSPASIAATRIKLSPQDANTLICYMQVLPDEAFQGHPADEGAILYDVTAIYVGTFKRNTSTQVWTCETTDTKYNSNWEGRFTPEANKKMTDNIAIIRKSILDTLNAYGEISCLMEYIINPQEATK